MGNDSAVTYEFMASWSLKKHLFYATVPPGTHWLSHQFHTQKCQKPVWSGATKSAPAGLQFTQSFLFRPPHRCTPREAHPDYGRKGFSPLSRTQQTTSRTQCPVLCPSNIRKTLTKWRKKSQKPETTSTTRALSPGWESFLLEKERLWGLLTLSYQGLIDRADPGSTQGASRSKKEKGNKGQKLK